MKDRYDVMLEAIEAERIQEESYFRELSHSKTFKERIESGILWYPVNIDKMHYSIAEKIEIEVTPATLKASSERNSFKEGASAIFFINDDERKEIKGTISYANRRRVRIILNGDIVNKNEIENSGKCGIELIYDDRPYRVMKETIKTVQSSSEAPIVELREGITKQTLKQRLRSDLPPFSSKIELNPSQKNAVKGCLSSERLGIIHGPPGTGKTTTLVALVEGLAKVEKKILVTAPSNNAVDLLARSISEQGISVLRIGNITRIGDHIGHLCLDEKVRSHKDWQHIKQIKIEAEAAKNEAAKYKRKFGPQQRRDRNAFHKEARELRKWAKELEYRLVDQIMEESVVVCTTLIGSAHPKLSGWKFDTVVIDEGSQALEAESWTPMLKGKRTIIAGDHQQLPPTVKSTEAITLGLTETILDRMTGRIDLSFLLDTQYRMNEQILAFSNEQFYNGQLKSANFAAHRSLPEDIEIVTFIDTSGCGFEEERSPHHRSLANDGEYNILREHVLAHINLLQPPVSIGIISPYARQVSRIRQHIGEDSELRALDIRVNSIDGFQGQEKDVIYISLVRSNDDGQIGFLKDYRRLNVAITRARYKLIVIGDMSTLGHDPMYVKLAEHIEKNAVYKSAWEYMYQ